MLGKRVLVIDDEENLRHYLQTVLGEEGYHVETASDGKGAIEKMQGGTWDIILCDIRMPVMDGMTFLKEVTKKGLEGTIIMMSAYGTVDTAVEAMKIGAYDYISKPFNADEIILTLKKAEERERLREENIRLREEVQRDYDLTNIVVQSEAMHKLFGFIKKVAQYKSSVLITGESGTGKELVARAIHHNSDRMLALAQHGYPRLTEDIDLLLTPSGLERFSQRLVGRGYRPAFSGAQKSFRDAETGVRIEVVTTGEFPGDGLPKPVAFPDPGLPEVTVELQGIHVVTLRKLIELKLASGISAPHRLRDMADVQDLIARLDLSLELADELDPTVREAYRDLWGRAQSFGRA